MTAIVLPIAFIVAGVYLIMGDHATAGGFCLLFALLTA